MFSKAACRHALINVTVIIASIIFGSAMASAAVFVVASTPRLPIAWRPVVWIAPPAPRVVVVPAPRLGQLWTPGYWRWTGGAYVWIDGAWIAERPGFVYAPSHWARFRGSWQFIPGGWVRRPL